MLAGDNIFLRKTDFAILDTQDFVLTQYIQAQSPVDIKLEGRIREVNATAPLTPTTVPTSTKKIPNIATRGSILRTAVTTSTMRSVRSKV
jgi:hypothetical protein